MAFDSNTCSATGSGLQESFTNIPAQFVVLTKKAGLVDDGLLQVKVTGVVNGIEARVRIRDNKNGSYNVAYIVTTPGSYLITVRVVGEDIAGSPFKLNAQPGPEPDRCKMYGSALEADAVLTIGKPIDFSVDTKNAGTGKLTIKAIGPGGIQARVFTAKDSTKGRHDIKLDPVRHGKYRVNVKWSGQHIPNSPFVLKIYPGVDPSKCKAFGPGLENGLVGVPTSFTIETKDAGPGMLRVCLHGVKDAFKIDLKSKDHSDPRTLIARYYPKKPGDYLVSIMWSEKHIPGSPFKVKITGESIEDDFRPNKFKPTVRVEELQVITEENEDTEDVDMEFEISSVVSGIRESRPISDSLELSSSLDGSKMPMFSSAASRQGYHDTFMHMGKRGEQTSKSLTNLEPEKMMTFSSLQQLRKQQKRSKATSPGRMNLKGKAREFPGQATLHMRTKHM